MRTKNSPTLLSSEVTISQSFHLLPQNESIAEYINQKLQLKEDDLSCEYYFIPRTKRNVFMLLGLIFGGPQAPAKLYDLLNQKNSAKVDKEILEGLTKTLHSQFSWENQKLPTNIFIDNMRQLQKTPIVYFLSQQLFPLISEKVAEEFFKYACQGNYLYGVRIRWEVCFKKPISNKQYRRVSEKGQCEHLDGSTYLLIIQEKNQFKVGMLKTSCLINSKSSIQKKKIQNDYTCDIQNIPVRNKKPSQQIFTDTQKKVTSRQRKGEKVSQEEKEYHNLGKGSKLKTSNRIVSVKGRNYLSHSKPQKQKQDIKKITYKLQSEYYVRNKEKIQGSQRLINSKLLNKNPMLTRGQQISKKIPSEKGLYERLESLKKKIGLK